MAARRGDGPAQPDLFSALSADVEAVRLDDHDWPDAARFPVNRPGATVRATIWPDLVGSAHPMVVVGYASIATLIDLIAEWAETRTPDEARMRIVLGTEPFRTARTSFADPHRRFTDEVRDHFFAQGISLERSARIVAAREAIVDGRLEVRAMVRSPVLHAKLALGDRAASVGSSNLTVSGLERQAEANARFERELEPTRHHQLWQIGENYWALASDWNQGLLELLDELLQVVGWQEALARACADLLDGSWLPADARAGDTSQLWPTQTVGIAQAMWIIEQVGSVLVADATGSGKTKMGAHLLRAVSDRLLTTGRARNQLSVLVCPPAVQEAWQLEATRGGLAIDTVSHGRLSLAAATDRLEGEQVRQAQLLAVDEAHNFLNAGAQRTRMIRDNAADHVVLFTATPISRGAGDLLDLVALLGPDNFADGTHAILRRLERRRAVEVLTSEDIAQLRAEIQRFTLRRTKRTINRMVETQPDAFRHHLTGRICRYPRHRPMLYPTAESEADTAAAREIRALVAELDGITQLPKTIAVPASLRRQVGDEQWLRFQQRSAAGLAAHHVLGALRSSRAALHEHLAGTAAAAAAFALSRDAKTTPTGDVVGKLQTLAQGPPPKVQLSADVPAWLVDETAWQERCHQELDRYERIARALDRIGPAREQAKAALLVELAERHARILAFDRHPTTLMVINDLLRQAGLEVLIATGRATGERTAVHAAFAPDALGDADTNADADATTDAATDASSTSAVIALCSDAMSEGINLQAASALVHLDLPTTLRVAEQRVGRVDRMDSRHDEIEAWWPRDGPAFATRANERLIGRVEESRTLLGGNLEVPDLTAVDAATTRGDDEPEGEAIVDPAALHEQTEQALAEPPDQLADALEPVRALVEGDDPFIAAEVYARMRGVTSPVRARVSPIGTDASFAFLAVRSSGRGVPRWMWIDIGRAERCETELATVVARLRHHLRNDPPATPLDADAAAQLDRCLRVAARHELDLLPRRSRRALEQLHELAQAWASAARASGDEDVGQRWLRLARLARPEPSEAHADPFEVAEAWLTLVAPRLEAHRAQTRGRRYALLRDIDPVLRDDPLSIDTVELALSDLAIAQPLAERVAVCILGVRSR